MRQFMCLMVSTIILGLGSCQRNQYDKFPLPQPGNLGSPGGFYFPDNRPGDEFSGIDSIQSWRPGGFKDKKPCERAYDEYCKEIPSSRDQEAQIASDNVGSELTDFQLQLFKASNTAENFVVSGISPQILLSYLNWGSQGQTRDQMLRAKIPGAPKQLQRIINQLSRGNNEKREMKLATAFFHSKDLKMNKDFLEKSRSDAKIFGVDFKNTQKAADQIRTWAEENTNGELDLSGISFDPDTKLSLASTLYFKGKWIYSFTNVSQETFHTPRGDIVVPMMNITRKYNYGKIKDFASWGTIPYESSKETMVIILPEKGVTIDEAINRLTTPDVYSICELAHKDWTTAELTISIPKFKISSTTNLVEPLKKMGVTKLFTPAAELPFIAENENLQVSSASQKASMEVSESGTVVVTYTQINAIALSIQRDPPKVDFKVDRPFIAMICDYDRSFPYVMAKITNPTL